MSEPTIAGFVLSAVMIIVFFVMASRLKMIMVNTRKVRDINHEDNSYKYQFAGDIENARKEYLMFLYTRWMIEKPYNWISEEAKKNSIQNFIKKYDKRLTELGGEWPDFTFFDFSEK